MEWACARRGCLAWTFPRLQRRSTIAAIQIRNHIIIVCTRMAEDPAQGVIDIIGRWMPSRNQRAAHDECGRPPLVLYSPHLYDPSCRHQFPTSCHDQFVSPLPPLRATLGTATPSRSLVYLLFYSLTAGRPPLSFSLFNSRVVAPAYGRRSRGRGRATTRLQSSSLFSRPFTGRYPCCRVFYDIALHIQIF